MKGTEIKFGIILLLIVMLMSGLLPGCASSKYDGYGANYFKYVDGATKAVNPNSGKLVEMIAVEGQNIELKGVKTFTVYAPASGQGDSGIKPPEQEKPSEWVTTVNSLIGTAASFGTTAVISSAVKGIVKATAENAGHNTSSVSTPTTTTTSTTSNANQSNTDSHNTSSASTTTSTVSTATTSTTSTDSHDTTSTATHTNTPTTTVTGGAAGTTYTGGAVTN